MSNGVLSALAADDFAFFEPHLRKISLARGSVIAEPGDEIETVYFPHAGVVSFQVALNDGAFVQTLMIGADSVVGAPQALDNNKTSLNKIVVQSDTKASTIHRDHLRTIVHKRPSVLHLLAKHDQFATSAIQQTAACNARHSVEQRASRWLLRMRDLLGSDFSITQESLADMIGVRRTSVTKLALMLQESGGISYTRGNVHVSDAKRVETSACECYRAVRNNYEMLFGDPWQRIKSATEQKLDRSRKMDPNGLGDQCK